LSLYVVKCTMELKRGEGREGERGVRGGVCSLFQGLG